MLKMCREFGFTDDAERNDPDIVNVSLSLYSDRGPLSLLFALELAKVLLLRRRESRFGYSRLISPG